MFSYFSHPQITAQWLLLSLICKAQTNKYTAQLRYMDASQICHIHMGEAHCCCVVVSCSLCEWDVDHHRRGYLTQTHWHMYTYAHLHTPTHFYLVAWLITASLGVFRGDSGKPFRKIFFFFSCRWFVIIIITGLMNVYLFFTIAVLASSSHLISLRWWRSRSPRVDTVTNPTFPQSASLTESPGDHIKHFPCFTLLLLLRFVFIRGV